MMSVTHLAIALACTSAVLGTADPTTLAIAAVGSQIPDLDTTKSMSGRIFWPVANWIEQRYTHRGVTHSALVCAVLAVLGSVIIWRFGLPWQWGIAAAVGQITAALSDACTKSGVQLFWPSRVWCVLPANPKLRLQTGSTREVWVLAIAVLALAVSMNLASSGGLTQQFSLAFFRDAGNAVEVFQQRQNQLIVLQVKGKIRSTDQPISGSYRMIGFAGKDPIAEGIDRRIYRIGTGTEAQILPTEITVQIGGPVATEAIEQTLEQVGVSEWLAKVPNEGKITGTITVDDAEGLAISPPIDSMATVKQAGVTIDFAWASRAEVEQAIADAWIETGKILITVRRESRPL